MANVCVLVKDFFTTPFIHICNYTRGGQSTARVVAFSTHAGYSSCKNVIFFSCFLNNMAQRAQKIFKTARGLKKCPPLGYTTVVYVMVQKLL